jgi:hypothetical protein
VVDEAGHLRGNLGASRGKSPRGGGRAWAIDFPHPGRAAITVTSP